MEKLGKALRFLNKGNKLEYFINLIRKHAHGVYRTDRKRGKVGHITVYTPKDW